MEKVDPLLPNYPLIPISHQIKRGGEERKRERKGGEEQEPKERMRPSDEGAQEERAVEPTDSGVKGTGNIIDIKI